jgi:hypothetical protein
MTQSTTKLVECMVRKHDCLTQLLALGARQRELIETGEMTQLLNVLAEKQRSIASLQECEQALDPFRGDDPDRRVWAGEAERLHCAGLASRCERMFAEVLACEKHCEEALRRRRDETAEQLSAVHTGGTVHSAYTDMGPASASILDLSAEF